MSKLNSLNERLYRIKTLSELKIILCIWLHSQGGKHITLNDFCVYTGLSKQSVMSGIESALNHDFIGMSVDDSDGGRVKRYFYLKF